MGRNWSPVLSKDLANLNSADSRKSAMRALESYVKDMDSESIPLFLSQLLETKEAGGLSEELAVSLYELLARVRGLDLVPYIGSTMEAILQTLASSRGSFHLQQSCSKVILAIVRCCVDSVTAEDMKRELMSSICMRLCDALLSSEESLSSGAALCLKALADSDNWKFTSDAMANKIILNVAVALEVKDQTNPHMGVVMALAGKNGLTVEPYARLLITTGLRILNNGEKDSNSQKRLSAIQMVNFLMKSLEPRCVYSELDLIIEEMEKYESDEKAFVSGAALEALQTARRIVSEKERNLQKDLIAKSRPSFVTSSRRISTGGSNRSPESHNCGSLSGFESPPGLANTPPQVSSDMDYDNGSVKHRVRWFENGVVNVPLKDGLFPEFTGNDEHAMSGQSRSWEMDDNGRNFPQEFAGFSHGGPTASGEVSQRPLSIPRSRDMDHNNGGNSSDEIVEFMQDTVSNGAKCRSQTPSPQRISPKFYIGNTHAFTSPKTPVYSRPNSSRSNSGSSVEKQSEIFTSSPSSKCGRSQTGSNDFDALSADPGTEVEEKENGNDCISLEQIQHQPVIKANRILISEVRTRKRSRVMVCSILFLLLALVVSLLWQDNPDVYYLVPT